MTEPGLTIVRTLADIDQTRALARDLSIVLRPGDVLGLDGPMGAGKTTLVRALVAAMGVDPAAISSPTYAIMNVYPRAHAAGCDVAHLDCSRLRGSDELETSGWDTLFSFAPSGPRPIVLVEWAERVEEALADAASTPGVCVARLRLVPIASEPGGDRAEPWREATLGVPASWAERPGFGGLSERPPTRCPVTGQIVPGDSPCWPFSSERARLADLHGWFSESYTISRRADQADIEQAD